RRLRYFSPVLRLWREFYVYTPPGYNQNTAEQYPVLYLFHGGGEDERGWSNQGKTDLILDNLIAEQKARPMLIVMPDGNMPGSAMDENGLKQFTAELKEGLIPYVEANFRAKSGAENRALAGLSMGGIQTLYAGVNNTETFGYLGVFSSGWIKDMQDELSNSQYRVMAENADKINKNLRHFWIAMGGEEDIAYQNCAHML